MDKAGSYCFEEPSLCGIQEARHGIFQVQFSPTVSVCENRAPILSEGGPRNENNNRDGETWGFMGLEIESLQIQIGGYDLPGQEQFLRKYRKSNSRVGVGRISGMSRKQKPKYLAIEQSAQPGALVDRTRGNRTYNLEC